MSHTGSARTAAQSVIVATVGNGVVTHRINLELGRTACGRSTEGKKVTPSESDYVCCNNCDGIGARYGKRR